MEWVGGGSMGKERRNRLSRSRSMESRDSSGRRSGSYQTQFRRKRFERDRLRSQSRSSDSNYSDQEFSNATYQSRKRHRKRKVEADASMNLPSEVSLDKLAKVMTSLVDSSNHQAGRADMAPDFDPEDRTITSESWCRKMDDLKVIFNWSDESTIYFAASKLRGLANAWYNGFPNRQYVWSEFKDKLKSAFPSKRNYYELLQQMMARRKLGNEKYVTYYYDKLSLLKVCNITGEDAVSCIVAGITDQAVRSGAEAADFIGLEALLGYMTAVENIPGGSKELTKDRKHNSKSGASTKSSAGCYICGMDDHYSNKCPQQPFKKTSPTSCYNCGSDGHFAKDCRNGGRCFRCGGEDHFVISCPQAKAHPAKVSNATCYMCGVEGHIAQFCPDAYKIRSKNCFTCHKRGHLAIVCPIAKYSPARCTYCGKVGHQENDCYNKMDDARYNQSQVNLSQQGVSGGGSSNLRSDPYGVYEESLNQRNDRDEYNYSVMALPKRQTEENRNPGNGQDEYVALSEGELGSEHST